MPKFNRKMLQSHYFKQMVPSAVYILGFILVLCQETSTASVPSDLSKPDDSKAKNATNDLFERHWEDVLKNNPEFATVIGDRRYDANLTCYSLECFENSKVKTKGYLDEAKQLLELFTEDNETKRNLLLFIKYLESQWRHLEHESYLFPISILSAPHLDVYNLLSYTNIHTEKEANDLITRCKKVPEQVDQLIELMRKGISKNYTLHQISLYHANENLTNEDDLEEKDIYKPFKHFAAVHELLKGYKVEKILQDAKDAILYFIFPALKKLDFFLENEYKPKARPDIGLSSLPNGKAFYEEQLAYHLTDAGVTADGVHQMGLEEIDRLTKEIEEVKTKLIPLYQYDRNNFKEMIRNDPAHFFSTPEEAIAAYQQIFKTIINPAVFYFFKFFPKRNFAIESAPKGTAFHRMAYYMLPSSDGLYPGTLFLDTNNLQNLRKYEVMTIALHEGVPGHHFQTVLAIDQEKQPKFKKYAMRSNAFREGWASYAESLGFYMGVYKDPIMLYGHLSMQIYQTARMVVDTGIHAKGWSRQQAINYLANYSTDPLPEVEKEIDRYITWPGQACSYKYGELKIRNLRQKALDSMGEGFVIWDFHDVILRNGGNLQLLEEQVDHYIDSYKSKKTPEVRSLVFKLTS